MFGSAEASKVLTASAELKALLTEVRGADDPLGGIYIGSPGFDNSTDLQIVALSPWVRITDLPGDNHEPADDDRFIEYPRVQIDFWTRKSLMQETSAIDDLIRQVMHANGWDRTYHASGEDNSVPTLRMTTAYFQSQGLPV